MWIDEENSERAQLRSLRNDADNFPDDYFQPVANLFLGAYFFGRISQAQMDEAQECLGRAERLLAVCRGRIIG